MVWYSMAQMQEMARNGTIRRDQQFYFAQHGRWMRADAIPGLANYFPQTGPRTGAAALSAIGIFLAAAAARRTRELQRLRLLSKSELRIAIFRRDKFTCDYCGHRGTSVTLEVDHQTPLARGGADDPSNMVTACWECNREKGTMTAGEFRWHRFWRT